MNAKRGRVRGPASLFSYFFLFSSIDNSAVKSHFLLIIIFLLKSFQDLIQHRDYPDTSIGLWQGHMKDTFSGWTV